MFPDKKKTIYGEKKSVLLKDFKEHDLLEAIHLDLMEELTGVNLPAMRVELKKAQADVEMKDAYVKAGLVGADLVWKAKSKKGVGQKVYSVVLYHNYARKEQEAHERFQQMALARKGGATTGQDHLVATTTALWQKYDLGNVARETAEKALALGVSPDGAWFARTGSNNKLVYSRRHGAAIEHADPATAIAAGKGPAQVGLDDSKAIKTASELQKRVALADDLADIRATSGYFASLGATEAETRLQAAVDNAWLVRGSSSQPGVITYSRKVAGKLAHTRIESQRDVQAYKSFIAGKAALQIKA